MNACLVWLGSKYLNLFASTINVGSIGKRPHTAVTAAPQSARELPTSPPTIITAKEASQDQSSSFSHRRHSNNHSFDSTASDRVPCVALSSAARKAGCHRAHSSIDNSGSASLCPDCPTFHHASLDIPPGGSGSGSGSVGGLLLDDEARLSFHADLLVALQHL